MKRKRKPWTRNELALLGKLPDAEVAELTGRTFGTVWQKRRALGIDQPTLRFRKWTPPRLNTPSHVSRLATTPTGFHISAQWLRRSALLRRYPGTIAQQDSATWKRVH